MISCLRTLGGSIADGCPKRWVRDRLLMACVDSEVRSLNATTHLSTEVALEVSDGLEAHSTFLITGERFKQLSCNLMSAVRRAPARLISRSMLRQGCNSTSGDGSSSSPSQSGGSSRGEAGSSGTSEEDELVRFLLCARSSTQARSSTRLLLGSPWWLLRAGWGELEPSPGWGCALWELWEESCN